MEIELRVFFEHFGRSGSRGSVFVLQMYVFLQCVFSEIDLGVFFEKFGSTGSRGYVIVIKLWVVLLKWLIHWC